LPPNPPLQPTPPIRRRGCSGQPLNEALRADMRRDAG